MGSPILHIYAFRVGGVEELFYDTTLTGAQKQFAEKYKRPALKSEFIERRPS